MRGWAVLAPNSCMLMELIVPSASVASPRESMAMLATLMHVDAVIESKRRLTQGVHAGLHERLRRRRPDAQRGGDHSLHLRRQ
jgi:hypothetical protein